MDQSSGSQAPTSHFHRNAFSKLDVQLQLRRSMKSKRLALYYAVPQRATPVMSLHVPGGLIRSHPWAAPPEMERRHAEYTHNPAQLLTSLDLPINQPAQIRADH